jgi:serine/threonine-protein kinase
MSIFTNTNFGFITVVWTIYVAYQYAKLWTDGYGWRDVFKQPQEKELIDVAEELLENIKALFDRTKRMELRGRSRARNLARRSGASSVDSMGRPSQPSAAMAEAVGSHGDRVRQAAGDRDEVVRLVNSLPDRERERVMDVIRSANLLFERVQSLAIVLSDLERNVVSGGEAALEAEVVRLESQANPLEAGSEERVRRLAFLKRQRRSVKDVQERRNAVANKLDTCSIALRNMKLDVLRLRAGSQTHQHVTSLALEAVSLAESVDSALYVADEVSRVTNRSGRESGRRSARSL